eukprot:COSAG02_NODE_1694_length_11277_cov_36.084855_4_plen_185_part_00
MRPECELPHNPRHTPLLAHNCVDNLIASTFAHRIRYTRKLGVPLGPAILDSSTGALSRHFKSGTIVTLGPSKTNSSADSLGFFSADINNVAGEVTQPSVRLAGKFASPLQCESICSKEPDCLSYTWCGPTKGGYAEHCYLRNDTVWQVNFAHRGTRSGSHLTQFLNLNQIDTQATISIQASNMT